MNTRSASVPRLLTLLAPTIAVLGAPLRAELKLYATGGGSALSALYTIDTATGAETKVLDLPNMYVYAGGLAWDPTSDLLYVAGSTVSDSRSRLFSIDRFSGVITSFPPLSPTIHLSGGGLAIHPLSGVLYATGQNGFQSSALFTLDKNTGAATLVGQCGGQCCTPPFGFNINGLGFRSDGTLFANGFTLSFAPVNGAYSELFTVDVVSGLATEIGVHGVNLGRQLAYSDLAIGPNGTMYSLGSISASVGGLYSVDPATGAATLIGPSVAQFGVDGGLAFAPDGQPASYCTAKTNSLGCTPTIGFSGAPSATSAAPFLISGSNVLNQKSGLLFYGYAQASTPFAGGWKCTADPTRRTAVQSSNGSALPASDCSGVFVFDFNAWIQGGADALLTPGQEVDAQYWSRDPASAGAAGLTDALTFQIGA